MALAADLAVPAQVDALAAEAITVLGGLDLLVVNSGHVPYGSLEDLTDDAWYGAFDLLMMSAVRPCRAAGAGAARSRWWQEQEVAFARRSD